MQQASNGVKNVKFIGYELAGSAAENKTRFFRLLSGRSTTTMGPSPHNTASKTLRKCHAIALGGTKSPQLGFTLLKISVESWAESFLPCDARSEKNGIAIISCPSLRLSVCLSVTLRYRGHI